MRGSKSQKVQKIIKLDVLLDLHVHDSNFARCSLAEAANFTDGPQGFSYKTDVAGLAESCNCSSSQPTPSVKFQTSSSPDNGTDTATT